MKLDFDTLEKVMSDSTKVDSIYYKRLPKYVQESLCNSKSPNSILCMLIRHFAAVIEDRLIYDEYKSMDDSGG